mmetsp:Transcript_58582/g.171915  ORF Transcript_58582/g.171915 Transcript_58582/m.171915 type:complete len:236 (+) Transcript_58582:263-970(+)
MRALDCQNSVCFCLTSSSALSAACWAARLNSAAHFWVSLVAVLLDSSTALLKLRLHLSLSFEPHRLTFAAVSRKLISHRSCSSSCTPRSWLPMRSMSCLARRSPCSFHWWTSSRSRLSKALRSSSCASFLRRPSSFAARIFSDHLRPISSFRRSASSCARRNFSTHFLASCSFTLSFSSFDWRSLLDQSEFIRSLSLRASLCMSFILPVHFHSWSFFRLATSSKERRICCLTSFS